MLSGAGAGGVDINKTNARLSASLSKHQPKVPKQCYHKDALWEHLEDNIDVGDFGLELSVVFEYDELDSSGTGTTGVKFYQYADELNLTILDGVKTATVPPRSAAGPIVITHAEQRENSGKNNFKLLKQRTESAKAATRKALSLVAWGISSAAAASKPSSITEIISQTGTIYGLNKATEVNSDGLYWMKSQLESSFGEFADNWKKLGRLFFNCVSYSPEDSDHPSMFMTDTTVYMSYWDMLPPTLRTAPSQKKGDAMPFQELEMMGVPFRFSIRCPLDADGDHQIFALNKKYIKPKVNSGQNFEMPPLVNLHPRQAISATQIYWEGNILCTHFMSQGYATGVKVTT